MFIHHLEMTIHTEKLDVHEQIVETVDFPGLKKSVFFFNKVGRSPCMEL